MWLHSRGSNKATGRRLTRWLYKYDCRLPRYNYRVDTPQAHRDYVNWGVRSFSPGATTRKLDLSCIESLYDESDRLNVLEPSLALTVIRFVLHISGGRQIQHSAYRLTGEQIAGSASRIIH